MSDWKKYPRTPHLPSSKSVQSDDVIGSGLPLGSRVVITEKMDGENTTMYRDGVHARSLDSGHHQSRSVVKSIQAQIGHMLPEGLRVTGENMYAKHSIAYNALPSFYLVFGAVQDDEFLSWDDTEALCASLGLVTVPVLYRGILTPETAAQVASGLDVSKQEGFVLRPEDSFLESEFNTKVAKWVRPKHVQTDVHWKKSWVPNSLA